MTRLGLSLIVCLALARPVAASCAFRTSAIATGSGTGTSVTMTAPTGAADGDILIAELYFENTTDTLTHATSWTTVRSDNRATSFRVNIDWLRRSGTPNLQWSWTTSVFFQYIIAAYSGCLAAGDPTDGNNGGNNSSTVPFRVTTFTTAANGDVLVVVNNMFSGCIPTTPTGFSSRQNAATGSFADLQQATAGATGNVDYTAGGCGTEQWITQLVALKQATGGGAACTPTLSLLGVGRCG